MVIVHLCGTAYLDGWGYQDNLLPAYQKKLGHEVHVVASGNHFPAYLNNEEREIIIQKGKDYDYNGVHIHRIRTYLSTSNFSFFYIGLFRKLCKIKPDIIFNHGVSAPLLIKSALYRAFNKNVKLVIDNHADYINCSKNKLWYNIYNKGIERIVASICKPLIKKAYGVTPLRCEYLHNIYGIEENKIDLLPIGGDTDLVKKITCTKEEIRAKYGVRADDMVIVSGGKMGPSKGTDNLIEAYKLMKLDYPNLKLVLFGKFEAKESENRAKREDGVILIGWCDRVKTLEILKMADIACWPQHHTTLIEDAVASGIPIIVRKTGNTSHLIQRNGQYVNSGTADELISAIKLIIDNYAMYKNSANEIKEIFSYDRIAKKVIEDCLYTP